MRAGWVESCGFRVHAAVLGFAALGGGGGYD